METKRCGKKYIERFSFLKKLVNFFIFRTVWSWLIAEFNKKFISKITERVIRKSGEQVSTLTIFQSSRNLTSYKTFLKIAVKEVILIKLKVFNLNSFTWSFQEFFWNVQDTDFSEHFSVADFPNIFKKHI